MSDNIPFTDIRCPALFVPRRSPKKKPPRRPAKKRGRRASRAEAESTALVPRDPAALAPRLEKNLKHAADLAAQARSENTRKAYDTDIRAWQAYAKDHGLRQFPITTGSLAGFVGHMDQDLGLKVATIRRRCVALAQWHREQGKVSPTEDVRIRELMRGLARTRGTVPNKKRALSGAMVRSMIEQIDLDDPRGRRDRAVILTGLATGMRRSELAALEWQHVLEDPDGLVLLIARSKGDQEGAGQYVGIPYIEDGDLCPATILLEWREDGDGDGSVFGVSDKTIYRLVKRYTEAAGLNPDEFGAHSFRAGFATEAGRDGATLIDIMAQTRHKSREVAQGYVQQTQLMENRAVKGVLRRLQARS